MKFKLIEIKNTFSIILRQQFIQHTSNQLLGREKKSIKHYNLIHYRKAEGIVLAKLEMFNSIYIVVHLKNTKKIGNWVRK